MKLFSYFLIALSAIFISTVPYNKEVISVEQGNVVLDSAKYDTLQNYDVTFYFSEQEGDWDTTFTASLSNPSSGVWEVEFPFEGFSEDEGWWVLNLTDEENSFRQSLSFGIKEVQGNIIDYWLPSHSCTGDPCADCRLNIVQGVVNGCNCYRGPGEPFCNHSVSYVWVDAKQE